MVRWRSHASNFLVLSSLSFSDGFTLTNYSDLLREIPGYKEIIENNDSNEIRRKTVKELLEMSHSQTVSDQNYEAFVDYNYNDYLDAFGRHSNDPYYEGVRVFEDVKHPRRDLVEERLENILGRDFFRDQKFVLFIVFTVILLVLVLSCCAVCSRWVWARLSSNSNKEAASTRVTSPVYQPISIPVHYSQPPVMFNDLEASFPDEAFLGNRKIYPGYL